MANDELYRRLQRQLDQMPVGFPESPSGLDIRILQQLFTPRDARIALCLSAFPETASTIHPRIDGELSLADLETALRGMAERGLIERRPVEGETRYSRSMFVIGIYERQLNQLTKELATDIFQYFEESFGQALFAGRTPQVRVVPVNKPIPVERNVAAYDDIRQFVRETPGPFATMNCVCRQSKDLMEQSCHQTSARENCLTFGPAATAMVNAGKARLIEREEMMGLLDLADREGLVLQPQNIQNPWFICCCCGCCCGLLSIAKRLPRPADYFHSTYTAEADAALCSVCGSCVSRCQMDAIAAADGPASVEAGRCIGCGLCVSTCPSGAMQLKKKEQAPVPARDMPSLYGQIYRERFGSLGMAKAVVKKVIGRPV